MNHKISQIEELRKRVLVLKFGDMDEADAIIRKAVLLAKKFFKKPSDYVRNLEKIVFSDESLYWDGDVEIENDWAISISKVKNILDIMIEDLKMPETPKPAKTKRYSEKKREMSHVFIVHGIDHEPVKDLKSILREAGLTPIILHEQAGGSRTIVEKLEKYSDVGYAFILLTPDDVGQQTQSNNFLSLVPSFVNKSGLEISSLMLQMFKPRARQNVVMEFGYFIGKLGRDRVCCLYKGNIELPSDMHGICYVHFQSSINEVKEAILTELKAAGYQIKKT